MENFIRDAEQLIDSKDVFWLSIQSNLAADVADAEESFNTQLQRLIQDLKSKSFVIPLFTANMRNSSQISNVKVEYQGEKFKMSSEIEKLSSTVMGQRPSLHLVNKEDVLQELPNLLNEAFDKIDNSSENSSNIVILYCEDSNIFNSNEIQMAISKTQTKHVNIFDPDNLSSEENENNLKHFLNNTNQILVVDQELFTGCEASNVIYLGDDCSANLFMRCALLRAVANLTLVFSIDNDDSIFTNFDGFELDTNKLKCYNTLKNYSWKCDLCKNASICKSCSLFCHRQHQLEEEDYSKNNGNPCQCNTSKRCKII